MLPLFIGVATTVIPLQIGARAIAFPRAAAAALWTWLIGAALMIAAYTQGVQYLFELDLRTSLQIAVAANIPTLIGFVIVLLIVA